MGPALISAGAGLIGGLLGISSGKSQQDRANEANMELAKYQFDRNVEMWKMQNEYNSPKAQMARLAEAGLNPNLIYGNGSASTGNAESAPQYQAPTMHPYTNFGDFGVSQAANLYLNSLNASADVKLKDANSLVARQNVINMQQDARLSVLKQYGEAMKNAKSAFELSKIKEVYNAEMANLESRTRGNNAGAELSIENARTENATRPARVAMLSQQFQSEVQRTLQLSFKNSLNPMVAQELAARIAQIKANTSLALSEAYLADEKAVSEGYLRQESFSRRMSVNWDTKLKHQRYDIKKVLSDYGLDIDNDALDRITYQSMGHNPGGFVNAAKSTARMGTSFVPFFNH